jgi:ankyrin repeat protein
MDDDVPLEDPWGSDTTVFPPTSKAPPPLPRSLDDATTLSQARGNVRFVVGTPEDPLVRAVLDDTSLSDEEKTTQLQSLFSRAASNGDIRCVRSILEGLALKLIDINAEDEDGITPLIHAACFGHADVVRARMYIRNHC